MFARRSARRPSLRLSTAAARRLRASRTGRRVAARLGVTLTEVLMSLLVMGIGVTSVATLFPLAVLRGARATQLTAGTILKHNAEETVRFSRSPSLEAPLPTSIGGVPLGGGVGTFPKGTSPGVERLAMLRDPDANGSLDLCGSVGRLQNNPAYSLAWGPAGSLYLTGGGTPRKYVVDPLGASVLANDGNAATSPWFFGVGASAGSMATNQFGQAFATADGFEPVLRFAWPFPWEMVNAAEDPAAAGISAAQGAALQRQMIETAYNVVGRSGDYSSELDVDASVTRRAGYLEVTFDDRDVPGGSLEEFFPQSDGGGNPSDDPAPAGADLARLVLFAFETNGQQISVAVPLARLRSQMTIDVVPSNVPPDDDRTILVALPRTGFLSAASLTIVDGDPVPLRVRLERPDRRYSWMLTCRRTGTGREEAQVAVFFNRALSAEDESTWRCVKTVQNGAVSYVLFWDIGASPAQRNPQVSGGSKLLEMNELSWLEVGRVLEAEGDPAEAGTPARITDAYARAGGGMTTPRYLEFQLSSGTPRINESGLGGDLLATFPRGVVSVYTLDP